MQKGETCQNENHTETFVANVKQSNILHLTLWL